MNNEKTITIQGKDVRMRYCAATETGYTSISGKDASVFSARQLYNDKGEKDGIAPPEATTEDYITLALAAIVAAYARTGDTAPVTSDDILYDFTPAEVQLLITTVVELRLEWYRVPEGIKQESTDKKKGGEKNA
jgi:hypothetical protein